MRIWRAAAVGVVAALAAGCGDATTDVLPTDGPNQVVLKVPGMT